MENEPSIFTRIINREIPAEIIYEDDSTIAFLTIEPINFGHTLVVPKKPFVNIFDGEEEIFGKMMSTAKRIAHALVQSKLADGVNIIMNCGPSAGQEVFHAHIHVVPRIDGDNALPKPQHVSYSTNEAVEIKERITKYL